MARQFVKELPFKLSASEVAVKAKDLASTELETVEIESEIARIKKEAKDEISELQDQLDDKRAHARRLARSVKSGEEYRDVECEERLSDDSVHVEIVRLDTGDVVDRRPATDEDRQMTFDQSVGEVLSKVEEDTQSADENEGMATHEQSDVTDDDEGGDDSEREPGEDDEIPA